MAERIIRIRIVARICAITIVAATPASAQRQEVCPMTVRGTGVVAEDIPDGIALRFVTTGDVTLLRARVRAYAALYRQRGTAARVEDIEGGARILLTPPSRDQLTTLRYLVHERADYMAMGRCGPAP